MVSVTLPSSLESAAPWQLALGAAAATALAYKLLLAPAPHERFRKANGLTTKVHPPKRLAQSSFLLGDLPELLRNATRFNDWVFEKTLECGGAPWLRHVPSLPDMVMVASPELVQDICKTQHDAFGKGDFTRELLYEMLGESFFLLDGESWHSQRKTAMKFFSAKMYRGVATPVVHENVAEIVAALAPVVDTGEQFNLTVLLNVYALKSFAELSFGLKIPSTGLGKGRDLHPLDEACEEAMEQVFHRVQSPTWIWKLQRLLNIGGERRYRETTTMIRDVVSELVSKSLAKTMEQGQARAEAATVVELFINAMRDGEGQYSPSVLCDIAILFVLGGRDTTAETLNWFFYVVHKHPEVAAKIRAELWEKAPELMTGKIDMLTMDTAQTLVYLEAAIKETLRLYPAAPLSPRQALKDTVLVDGTFVAKGTGVGISGYALGRLPSVWGEDALLFKPERFLDPATDKLRVVSPYQFFSFGAGPRACIGQTLAMLEMKLLVSTLLSRFRFDVAPNDGSYKFSGNLSLKEPLIASVHKLG